MAYSQGFHPMPKVAFQNALPVYMESLEERALVTLLGEIDPNEVMFQLDRELPHGVNILQCGLTYLKKMPEKPMYYKLESLQGPLDEEPLLAFFKMDECILETTNKKGKIRSKDLKKAVKEIFIRDDGDLELELEPGVNIKPLLILEKIYGKITPASAFRITKLPREKG